MRTRFPPPGTWRQSGIRRPVSPAGALRGAGVLFLRAVVRRRGCGPVDRRGCRAIRGRLGDVQRRAADRRAQSASPSRRPSRREPVRSVRSTSSSVRRERPRRGPAGDARRRPSMRSTSRSSVDAAERELGLSCSRAPCLAREPRPPSLAARRLRTAPARVPRRSRAAYGRPVAWRTCCNRSTCAASTRPAPAPAPARWSAATSRSPRCATSSPTSRAGRRRRARAHRALRRRRARRAARSRPTELAAALDELAPDVRDALEVAHGRIAAFHRPSSAPTPLRARRRRGRVVRRARSTGPAATCPAAGRAYPSTVLMTAVPARVAGVPEVVLCVPPRPHDRRGRAGHAGRGRPRRRRRGLRRSAAPRPSAPWPTAPSRSGPVDVIVGPGNVYVALAKREVAGDGRRRRRLRRAVRDRGRRRRHRRPPTSPPSTSWCRPSTARTGWRG